MNRLKSVKKRYLYVGLVLVVLLIGFNFWTGGSRDSKAIIPISQVLQDLASPNSTVQEVQLTNSDDTLVIKYKDGSEKLSRREIGASDFTTLLKNSGYNFSTGPDVRIKDAPASRGIVSIITFLLPILLFVGVIFFVMRGSQGANSQALGFGKSRARRFEGVKVNVTFQDVAGVEESKQELAEIVEFLKYPDKFVALGARIPKGVLLVGPPGTGKTMLSKAVAGEAGVPFFSISGSEFVEMFVGVGASRVRDMFEQAKKSAPCIIFIDEIDAVGRRRGSGMGGGQDEREQTLNQMLVEMDGFDSNTNVIVIAATNRPDVLDPALLRPGRFDRQVILDRPDMRGRLAVLQVHAQGKPFETEVSLEKVAKQTTGFSGADLANLLNEAAILAARRNRKTISMSELDEAVLRVLVGPQRYTHLVTDKQKLITAYHEVGHALVARMLGNVDPVHKITIIPRGRAGGLTVILPGEDRQLGTKGQFEAQITWGLGGRVAEEIIFEELSSGASNDIEKVTEIARTMVTRYGMSQKLGPIAFTTGEHMTFLGGGFGESQSYSNQLAYEIDSEVRSIIDSAYLHCRKILLENREKLIEIAELLMVKETLEGAEFEEMFGTSRPEPIPLFRTAV